MLLQVRKYDTSTNIGRSMRPPRVTTILFALIANARADPCAPRRVYIDLGTNWANTLHLYKEHEPWQTIKGAKLVAGERRSIARPGATPRSTARPAAPPVDAHAWGGWEVYGFEASPLIQPYVDDMMRWLDGTTSNQPVLCVPPTGSSKHLALWAPRYGCPGAPLETMRNCVWSKLARQLGALRPSAALNSSTLVEARLRVARQRRCPPAPPPLDHAHPTPPPPPRYTFVPAAAGTASLGGWLKLWSPPEQVIRGGGRSDLKPGARRELSSGWFDVRAADVSAWVNESFSPRDHVVMKIVSANHPTKQPCFTCPHRLPPTCEGAFYLWVHSTFVLTVHPRVHVCAQDIEGGEHELLPEMAAKGSLQLIDVLLLECHNLRDEPMCPKLKQIVARAAPHVQQIRTDALANHRFDEAAEIDEGARLPVHTHAASRTPHVPYIWLLCLLDGCCAHRLHAFERIFVCSRARR